MSDSVFTILAFFSQGEIIWNLPGIKEVCQSFFMPAFGMSYPPGGLIRKIHGQTFIRKKLTWVVC